MSTDQTVSTFIEFFRGRGHQLVRGGSLLPAPGDPVLFTSAGMHPLTPYLAGRRVRSAAGSRGFSAACAPPTWTR